VNSRNRGENSKYSVIPHNRPAIKDPRRFTVRVPNGNVPETHRWAIPLSPYRASDPSAPPAIMYNTFNINPIEYARLINLATWSNHAGSIYRWYKMKTAFA
jgi:hypothetical protein